MTISIEIGEQDLKRLVKDELKRLLGDHPFDLTKVRIYVKSKQNYKSEWEEATFKASYIEVS
jgi:hypothetical protein